MSRLQNQLKEAMLATNNRLSSGDGAKSILPQLKIAEVSKEKDASFHCCTRLFIMSCIMATFCFSMDIFSHEIMMLMGVGLEHNHPDTILVKRMSSQVIRSEDVLRSFGIPLEKNWTSPGEPFELGHELYGKNQRSLEEKEKIHLRRSLEDIIERLHINSILDAKSGDGSWQGGIKDIGKIDYLGTDRLISNLQLAIQNQDNINHRLGFSNQDPDELIEDGIFDLILYRNGFETMVPEDATALLRKFENSGSKYIALTTWTSYDDDSNEEKYEASDVWYEVNVLAPPFQLGAPIIMTDDVMQKGNHRAQLAVWPLETLRLAREEREKIAMKYKMEKKFLDHLREKKELLRGPKPIESQRDIKNDPESARYHARNDVEDLFAGPVANSTIPPTTQKMKRPDDLHHELRSKERIITKIDYETIECTRNHSPNINSQGSIGCQGARYGYRGNGDSSKEYCMGLKDGNLAWPWFKKCCVWEETKQTCESVNRFENEKEEDHLLPRLSHEQINEKKQFRPQTHEELLDEYNQDKHPWMEYQHPGGFKTIGQEYRYGRPSRYHVSRQDHEAQEKHLFSALQQYEVSLPNHRAMRAQYETPQGFQTFIPQKQPHPTSHPWQLKHYVNATHVASNHHDRLATLEDAEKTNKESPKYQGRTIFEGNAGLHNMVPTTEVLDTNTLKEQKEKLQKKNSKDRNSYQNKLKRYRSKHFHKSSKTYNPYEFQHDTSEEPVHGPMTYFDYLQYGLPHLIGENDPYGSHGAHVENISYGIDGSAHPKYVIPGQRRPILDEMAFETPMMYDNDFGIQGPRYANGAYFLQEPQWNDHKLNESPNNGMYGSEWNNGVEGPIPQYPSSTYGSQDLSNEDQVHGPRFPNGEFMIGHGSGVVNEWSNQDQFHGPRFPNGAYEKNIPTFDNENIMNEHHFLQEEPQENEPSSFIQASEGPLDYQENVPFIPDGSKNSPYSQQYPQEDKFTSESYQGLQDSNDVPSVQFRQYNEESYDDEKTDEYSDEDNNDENVEEYLPVQQRNNPSLRR